jgi:putative flippase GtrA
VKKPRIQNKDEKARFLVVGGANTAIDFGLLFLLKATGLPTIPANVASTTTAFVFSFFANKKYTFQARGTDLKREILLFVAVTLFGLWVLQTLVIQGVTGALAPLSLGSTMTLLAAKLCATLVSLVWNYVLYSRVVFKKDQRL